MTAVKFALENCISSFYRKDGAEIKHVMMDGCYADENPQICLSSVKNKKAKNQKFFRFVVLSIYQGVVRLVPAVLRVSCATNSATDVILD